MRRGFIASLVCIALIVSASSAKAQLNIGGLINEMARHAAEQQRYQAELDARRRAERAAVLEQRRRDAEIRAQAKLEADRRAAALKAEEQRKSAAAAEQAAREKARERAEEERKAASALIPAAKQLIEDATEFLKTSPSKSLELVEQISTLNGTLTEIQPNRIQSAMQSLVELMRSQEGYEAFEQKRGELKRAEANAHLADLIKVANQQQTFIRYYVTNNPTSASTRKLLPLLKRLASVANTPEMGVIQKLTGEVDIAIREAGLNNEFIKSKNLLASGVEGATGSVQANALRKTQKNSFLIDGDAGDFVLLYNHTSKAPHIVKNLRGEFDFEGGKATACIYQTGFSRNESYLLSKTLQTRNLKSANIDIAKAECNRSDLSQYDVIAMDRGAFLRLKPELALPVLSEIENDRYKSLATVTNQQRLADRQADEDARRRIKSDIKAGGRNGFGIIIEKNNIAALCIVASDSLSGHRRWINDNADRLSTEFSMKVAPEKNNIDMAFRAIERDECGAIYASAEDLQVYGAALDRERREYQPASLWVTGDEIRALAKLADEEQATEAREAESRKQTAEAERRIASLQAQEQSSKREARQSELRAKYGKIASSTAAAIAKEVQESFESSSDWQNTRGFRQYPRAISAYRNLVEGRWELQSFNSDVFDYGTAEWKGRSLDTSVSRVSVRMRNRILGQYKDLCFIFGRMNDAEFGMLREPIGVSCVDTAQISAWKRSNGFKSLWFAE